MAYGSICHPIWGDWAFSWHVHRFLWLCKVLMLFHPPTWAIRDFRRRKTCHGFPEYPVNVVLKDLAWSMFPTGPNRLPALRISKRTTTDFPLTNHSSPRLLR